jgi:hypothetical protein
LEYLAYAKHAGISSLRKTRWKIHVPKTLWNTQPTQKQVEIFSLRKNTLEYPAYAKTSWKIHLTQNTLEYPAYAKTG